MPVLLAPEEHARWLDCGEQLAADDPLFQPRIKQPLRVRPISRQVNNARNKGLELIEPGDEELLLQAG